MSSPLIRRSTLSEPKDNLFGRFYLKDNPFPREAVINPKSEDPRLNGSIYVTKLREKEEKLFEEYLIPNPERQQPRNLAFLMDYATRIGRGIGKSAFLLHQQRRIMKDLGGELSANTQVITAAHIMPSHAGNSDVRNFTRFSRMLVTALNEMGCIEWAMWRLRATSTCIPPEVLEKIHDDFGDTIGNNLWLDEHKVDTSFSLLFDIRNKLSQSGVSTETVEILAYHGHNSEDFEKNVLFVKSDSWWRKHGTHLLFHDLPLVFREAGINKTILLLDEVEKIIRKLNREERRSFIEDIRRYFIDGTSPSVKYNSYSLLLTIHPELQEIMVADWSASGLDRIAPIGGENTKKYTILFHPIESVEVTKELIIAYLDEFRDENGERHKLYPFTDNAVIKIFESWGGVPGILLNRLFLLMEEAVKQDWRQISASEIINFKTQTLFDSEANDTDNQELTPAIINLHE